MQHFLINLVAQTYGSGAYGSGAYSTTTSSGTSASGAVAQSSTSSGQLTNTGFDILLIATLACTLIFLALIIKFWRRKAASQG